MHKQVSGWTVNFCPNSPESPCLEFQTRKPPPPKWKTSDLRWLKFTPKYPLPKMKNFRFEMTKVYSEIPPQMKNFRFEMTKVYSEIPPPPPMKNFRFEMTKVYSKIPPSPMKNFRFEMTKVYSEIPPHPIFVQSGRSYVETNLYPPWIPLVCTL